MCCCRQKGSRQKGIRFLCVVSGGRHASMVHMQITETVGTIVMVHMQSIETAETICSFAGACSTNAEQCDIEHS